MNDLERDEWHKVLNVIFFTIIMRTLHIHGYSICRKI